MSYRIRENFEEIARSIPDLNVNNLIEEKPYTPADPKSLNASKLAYYIDHTLLKPDATPAMVEKLCQEAMDNGFFSVCINPTYVKLASAKLAGSRVAVCTVIGFPLGANTSAVKAEEARDAVANGAEEIDMVINIGALKAGDYRYVYDDIKAVVEAAGQDVLKKVIIETCLLTDDEKVKACLIAKAANCDFVRHRPASQQERHGRRHPPMRAAVGLPRSQGVRGIRDTTPPRHDRNGRHGLAQRRHHIVNGRPVTPVPASRNPVASMIRHISKGAID